MPTIRRIQECFQILSVRIQLQSGAKMELVRQITKIVYLKLTNLRLFLQIL